ncbi:MAG: pilus assembly protein CpaF [Actinomycetota bacterium]|nr:pilus assembly protein CpaF [Actinomycetota bacterium]
MPLQVLRDEPEPVRLPLFGASESTPVATPATTATRVVPAEPAPMPQPSLAIHEQPAPVPVSAPAIATSTGITAQDQAAWDALVDRLLDLDCTEINILANSLTAPEPYHVVVNVNTRYLDETHIRFADEASLRRVLSAFIIPASILDIPEGHALPPMVDGTFTLSEVFNGVTEDVQARIVILSPPATYRTEVHFQKLPNNDIGLDTLIENGTMPVDAAYFLSAAVKAGLNIVFSGIPNTGKTTLLNACAYEIPASEKVAVIQDVDELLLPHLRTKQMLFTHRALAKSLNGISDGSASSLIEVVKRTRPTRLFTGECRSAEMYDHLEASSIFHGCMTTVHAANAEQAIHNMLNMAAKHSHAPNVDGLRVLIASGVDLVVQLGVHNERRIVTEILELDGTTTADGVLRRQRLWAFNPETGHLTKGPARPCERTLRKLAAAGQPDYWSNTPNTN